jgi:hypothetical protein
MSSFRLIACTALVCRQFFAADGPAGGPGSLPPVLRHPEPADSVMVMLPGAPPKVAKIPIPEPAALPAPQPVGPTAPPPEPVPPPEGNRPTSPEAVISPAPALAPKPAAEPRNAFLPPDLQKEVAVFCQKLIGQWTASDAEQLLGKPIRQRPSFDEKKAVNGRIYAFSDPSGRYRELELDFDLAGGVLRTVFAYPKLMTWQECRRRWNGEVSEADAQQGRTFYSYLNRRLDVLVDGRGRVISLGLY